MIDWTKDIEVVEGRGQRVFAAEAIGARDGMHAVVYDVDKVYLFDGSGDFARKWGDPDEAAPYVRNVGVPRKRTKRVRVAFYPDGEVATVLPRNAAPTGDVVVQDVKFEWEE